MSDDLELPRGIALAWGVAASPQRGPKREMSVERIVDAAVELADAEGIGAVSMAAVASRLGFTPMSLYRYVSAKDDLLMLMQEQATGVPPAEHREHDDWRERLRALFEAQVRIYMEHPWLLELPILGSPITPNSSAWIEAGLGALDGTPLGDSDRMAIALGVMGIARWNGQVFAGYAQNARSSGLSPQEAAEREAALFDRVITADEFPSLRRAIDGGVFIEESDPFRFGLERMLAGVAEYVTRLEGGEQAETYEPVATEPEAVLDDKKVKEARRAVQAAEKALRLARKEERAALREAHQRLDRS